MIPEVPTSRILLVLATLVAVMALISSWVPQVAGSPIAPAEWGKEQRRKMCSTELSDLIQEICASQGTVAHGDGKRRKRDVQNVADQCCKQGGCTFWELMQFCKG
ncbi:probable insulin-like peptide 6 [Drosophila suzukii]|uniref:Probable insulin-like peptide 6 n=1 Tax=Drosophila suzukii TaxID=28584 RepID=A0AB39ZLZ3_DROSZ|nr:probable insulin-like peptide 6 [Drosophila suzukii]